MSEKGYKVGDRVCLKEDSEGSVFLPIKVSKDDVAEVLEVKDDCIYVKYDFLISWAYAKYFELAEYL